MAIKKPIGPRRSTNEGIRNAEAGVDGVGEPTPDDVSIGVDDSHTADVAASSGDESVSRPGGEFDAAVGELLAAGRAFGFHLDP
jgi:hypothetical protein